MAPSMRDGWPMPLVVRALPFGACLHLVLLKVSRPRPCTVANSKTLYGRQLGIARLSGAAYSLETAAERLEASLLLSGAAHSLETAAERMRVSLGATWL
jgi:hypothetical protein